MIFMADTKDIDECEKEINCKCERLVTPIMSWSFKPVEPDRFYAIDNGAFGGFDLDAFAKVINVHRENKDLCRWVALPDVPGDARRTIECWHAWKNKDLLYGFKKALVCQDGIESLDIPWHDQFISAVFIGGSTEWKMSKHAAAVIKAAKIIGKWCHVGRVNTPDRWAYFEELGADSVDGSGLSRYSHMRRAISADKLQLRLAKNET